MRCYVQLKKNIYTWCEGICLNTIEYHHARKPHLVCPQPDADHQLGEPRKGRRFEDSTTIGDEGVTLPSSTSGRAPHRSQRFELHRHDKLTRAKLIIVTANHQRDSN